MNSLIILKVKKLLRSIRYRESQELVKAMDQFTIGKDIEDFMKQEMVRRFPEDFLSIDQYDFLPCGCNNKMMWIDSSQGYTFKL